MSLLKTDRMLRRVSELELSWLQERGIRGIVSDLDNTLAAWHGDEIPSEILAWLDAVKSGRLRSAIRTFADHAQQVRDITLRAPEALHAALACQSEVLDGFVSNERKMVQRAMEKLIKSAESFYFASADRP